MSGRLRSRSDTFANAQLDRLGRVERADRGQRAGGETVRERTLRSPEEGGRRDVVGARVAYPWWPGRSPPPLANIRRAPFGCSGKSRRWPGHACSHRHCRRACCCRNRGSPDSPRGTRRPNARRTANEASRRKPVRCLQRRAAQWCRERRRSRRRGTARQRAGRSINAIGSAPAIAATAPTTRAIRPALVVSMLVCRATTPRCHMGSRSPGHPAATRYPTPQPARG